MRLFLAWLAVLLLGGCGLLASQPAQDARDQLLALAAKALVSAAQGQDVDTQTAVCLDMPELSDGEKVYALCWAEVTE